MRLHSYILLCHDKTITLRLQQNKYQRFKQLAEYNNRSISNFIENAALRFIEEEEYLDDFENDEILSNKELMGSIQQGYEESIEGKGKLIENGYIEIKVSALHAMEVIKLPFIHRDPFDRILVATAIWENMPLVNQ